MWIYIVRTDFGGETHNLVSFKHEANAKKWLEDVKDDLLETLNAKNTRIEKVEMIDP